MNVDDLYAPTIYIEDLYEKVPLGNWNYLVGNPLYGKALFSLILKEHWLLRRD